MLEPGFRIWLPVIPWHYNLHQTKLFEDLAPKISKLLGTPGDICDLGVRALLILLYLWSFGGRSLKCVLMLSCAVWGLGWLTSLALKRESIMVRWTRKISVTSSSLYSALLVAPSMWKSLVVLGSYGKARLVGGAVRGPFASPRLLSLASSLFLSLALERELMMAHLMRSPVEQFSSL